MIKNAHIPHKSLVGLRNIAHGYTRLFGGDAAKQRAEIYAAEHGINPKVFETGSKEAPFAALGLDPWGRGQDGIVYSHVVIDPPLTPC
jgi:hypothetical protein